MKNLDIKSKTLQAREIRATAPRRTPANRARAAKISKLQVIASFGPEIEEPITVVAVEVQVRPGDNLYIRGQGSGLSWDTGQPMTWVEPAKWVWCTQRAERGTEFKVLLNDELWCAGENFLLRPGDLVTVRPRFDILVLA